MANRVGWFPGPASWRDDLTPIGAGDWNYDRAAHLLAHAGFGGTPAEIEALTAKGLEGAVRSLVHYESIPNPRMQPFVESGLWDPTLAGFPESRPEATDRAARDGRSMGIDVKPAGNRPVQPVSDRFFYWLRATMLETRRLGYWWANRMLQTSHPVEEKMALLWHGHFATHENKVRDYRKMMQQIDLFERGATGNLRELTIAVARNPAANARSWTGGDSRWLTRNRCNPTGMNRLSRPFQELASTMAPKAATMRPSSTTLGRGASVMSSSRIITISQVVVKKATTPSTLLAPSSTFSLRRP